MGDRLQWETDGRDWPLRSWSRWVTAGGLRWHVQVSPTDGPVALLVHGTGASTHSWRSLAPLLARRYRVVAMDLPGHGFTQGLPAGAVSLPGIARVLGEVLRELQLEPQLAVGHSAGAAILARMQLDGTLGATSLVSINGALLPLPGWSGAVFPPVARLLATNSLAARIFAWGATDPAAVRRLVASTGSVLDRAGLDLYARLIRNPAHVAGTLQMMAGWDLEPLQRELARLAVPLLLLVGMQDGTVAPTEAERVQRILPGARLVRLPGLGHLAHEEDAAAVAAAIGEFTAAVY
jgi:magnesium chelatase accessory protein